MNSPGLQGVDVEDLPIARVYAEAGYNAAKKKGSGSDFAAELDSLVGDVLDAQPKLEAFFRLGSITVDQRAKVLDDAFKGRCSDALLNLLKTMNAHGRLGLVRAVAHTVHEMEAKESGRRAVLVRSAQPISEEQKTALTKALAAKYRVEPVVQFETDPELLGGLVIRVGETVFDRSVRTNLERLRETMVTRSFHEIQSGRNRLDHSA